MATTARLPASAAARASACPKLPEETVRKSGWGAERTRCQAARNLKLPVSWKVSETTVTSAPSRSDSRGA